MKKWLIIPILAVLLLLPTGCSAISPYPDEAYFGDQVYLVGDGRVWFELRPDLDFETVKAQGKPVRTIRGIVKGWEFPIYNDDNQELFLEMHAPDRWDEASDVHVHIHCYLDTANTDKNFNLQFSWVYYTEGDIVPNTSEDLPVETSTGTAVQYQSYRVDFLLHYDIIPAQPLESSDELHFRLRRLDASTDEIAGKVVITHVGLVFRRDKLGSPVP